MIHTLCSLRLCRFEYWRDSFKTLLMILSPYFCLWVAVSSSISFSAVLSRSQYLSQLIVYNDPRYFRLQFSIHHTDTHLAYLFLRPSHFPQSAGTFVIHHSSNYSSHPSPRYLHSSIFLLFHRTCVLVVCFNGILYVFRANWDLSSNSCAPRSQPYQLTNCFYHFSNIRLSSAD